MSKGRILILGSNATRIEVRDGAEPTGPTGQYLNETVVPAMAFIDAGYEVVLATPDGTKPHIDEASDSAVHFGGDEAAYQRAKRFYAEDPSMNARTLRSAIDEGLDNYAAIFAPGGQAPVVDLMQDRISAKSCAISMRRGSRRPFSVTDRWPLWARCRRRANSAPR
jgi:hypothetical protein